MAPPGVYSFTDQVDIVSISSYHWPSFVKSSSSSPASQPLSSRLPIVQSDHDYVIKPLAQKTEMSAQTFGHSDTVEEGVSEKGHDSHKETMLSSCVVDDESMTGESMTGECGNADLLQELDDLDFTFADLDPCSDVTMEDCSFQDFIDSALDQSYPSFLDDHDTPESCHSSEGQDAVILNKEDFLRTLNLMPVQKKEKSTDSVMLASPSLISNSSGDKVTSSDITSPHPFNSAFSRPMLEATGSTLNVIPTKKCSCSVSDNVSTAVYSTAHASLQAQVRTCSSTTDPRRNSNSDTCANCSLNRTVPEDLMTPLFIDTSSYGFSDTFQPLSDECLALLMDEDMPPTTTDAAAVEFFKWLDDNQQTSNSNKTFTSKDDASVFTETSSHVGVTSDSLDLESFVDLEELVTCTNSQVDSSQSSHQDGRSSLKDMSSSWRSHDHTYQKLVDQSKFEQRDEEMSPCYPQLKLSFLSELCDHRKDAGKNGRGSDSLLSATDQFRTGQRSTFSDSLSVGNSDEVLSLYSPGVSSTSSLSPSPLTSLDMPLSDECTDTANMKTHLALLDLFSDENASSLLHVDSAISSIRYI